VIDEGVKAGLDFRVTKDLGIVLCVVLPGSIVDDLQRCLQAMEADRPQNLKSFGLGGITFDAVIETLRAIYELSS